MSIPYDVFTDAFLSKITEYEFIGIPDNERTAIIDSYMKRATTSFNKICVYDLTSSENDEVREFEVDVPETEISEIAEIISEGMIVQWLKPYLYRQELLETVLNTRDYYILSR